MAAGIKPVPNNVMYPGIVVLVGQGRHYLPKNIEDRYFDVISPGQGKTNGCCRIEGIGVVLIQLINQGQGRPVIIY